MAYGSSVFRNTVVSIEQAFCYQHGQKIILVGSRLTHSVKSGYTPIEIEALAVVDSLNKARHFVLGCSNLVISVDHKSLLETNFWIESVTLDSITLKKMSQKKWSR